MSNRRENEYQSARDTIELQTLLTISCETITNQTDDSNKNHSNVDEIHVRDIDENEMKSVYHDLQIDIDARDERMIYVDDNQETQKRCH